MSEPASAALSPLGCWRDGTKSSCWSATRVWEGIPARSRSRGKGQTFPVDTGFIVFNERNYPYFSAMLRALGVATRPTTMSFSVRDEKADFEYGSALLMAVVGRWQQLAHPRWWRVVSGLVHLARRGKAILAELPPETTLEELIEAEKFSRGFLEDYLLPMAAAIWSCRRRRYSTFPPILCCDFSTTTECSTSASDRSGGPFSAVRIPTSSRCDLFSDRSPASARWSSASYATRTAWRSPSRGATEHFDHVVFATHADQALALLSDATPTEQQILAAMPFQSNTAVLHHDARQLPERSPLLGGVELPHYTRSIPTGTGDL